MKHNFPLPCPWCGTDPGLARVSFTGSVVTYQVGCESDECAANPQVTGYSSQEAWDRWNTRWGEEKTLIARELASAGGLK